MEVLRLKADLGDDHAQQRLVHWLARLRERAQADDEYAEQALAEWQDPQG
jgi:CRP-like cAMP-binding protein